MNWVSTINWLALAAFYFGVFFFFYKHKKDVAHQWGIFFSYHTQYGIKFIKNLAKRMRRFWIIYGYIGIPVAFLMMLSLVFLLVTSVLDMFAAPQAAAPVAGIVVPWPSTGVHGAIITVNVWYFIIAVLVTLLVHEGAHAVISAVHNKRIKSTGVGLFAIIPFAFVEPDEAQIEKSPTRHKLAIFAAGPFTNLVTAILVILLTIFLIVPPIAGSMQVNGIDIKAMDDSMPAGLSELTAGDVITRIDDVEFTNIEPVRSGIIAISYTSLLGLPPEKLDALYTEPGQTVEIETAGGKVVELTAESTVDKPNTIGKLALRLGLLDEEQFKPRGVLGFEALGYRIEQKSGTSATKMLILGTLYSIFAWIAIFNLGIGLFNTLPIGPLDGGRMMRASLRRIFRRKKRIGLKLASLVSTLMLATLLFGIFGAYLLRLF